MKSHFGLLILFVLTLAVVFVARAADEPKPATSPQVDEQPAKIEMNELEIKFEKMLTGATLVGRFSTTGKEDKPGAPDRYEIVKATKIGKEMWLLTARVGKGKVALPLPVPVKWAGDTPVISVTKFSVPTMGTYTARVLFYDNQYAGTWDAGDHGGHLWGKIEHEEKKPGPGDEAKQPAAAKKSE